MNDCPPFDAARLLNWIGRTDSARDLVTPRLVQELAATLNSDSAEPEMGSEAQLAIHWCLAPPAIRTSALGADGHPARGGFLPPVPLPRRMWAGGRLQVKDRLLVGDAVERRSRIADVTVKEGRSGTLCFVAVDHEIVTPRGPAIFERQDIVYRGLQSGPAAVTAPAPLPKAQWTKEGIADPVLLFRYSALTFNGHRIHYDRGYATEVEGYPGLVCHGPLQATLLLEFAAAIKGRAPSSFSFRNVHPLFDGVPFQLCARDRDGGLDLRIQTADGVQTVVAEGD